MATQARARRGAWSIKTLIQGTILGLLILVITYQLNSYSRLFSARGRRDPPLDLTLAQVIEANRQAVRRVPHWVTDSDYTVSYKQYGLPSYVKDYVDQDMGSDPTYADVLGYVLARSSHFPSRSDTGHPLPPRYLELGVSFGKTYYQVVALAAKYKRRLVAYGFDIEEPSSVLRDLLGQQSIVRDWTSEANSSDKKRQPRLLDYTSTPKQEIHWDHAHEDLVTRLVSADEYDDMAWRVLAGDGYKFNLILSDSAHNPDMLQHEYDMLVKHTLLDPQGFFIIYDDLNRDFFRTISTQLEAITPTKAMVLNVRGWLGEKEGRHHVGMIATKGMIPVLMELSKQLPPTQVVAGGVPLYMRPPKPQVPKSAIVFKVGGRKGMNVKFALCLLDRLFNDQYHYPVVIFHDDLSAENQTYIQSGTRSQVEFHQLIPYIPDYINQTRIPEWYEYATLPYFQMNQFRVVDFWSHPAMQKYDYFLQLDTDTYLTAVLPFDPFKLLQDENLVYAYVNNGLPDPEKATIGILDAVQEFVKREGITPQHLDRFIDNNGQYTRFIYYGCFAAGRLSFFRDASRYGKFADFIARKGGIFYYRWADQGLIPLAISLYEPLARVRDISNDIYIKHAEYAFPGDQNQGDRFWRHYQQPYTGPDPMCEHDNSMPMEG